MKYFRLMRIKHYLKNVLIFFPLIFSGRLLDGPLLVKTLLGFCSFSLLASAIYVLNDIQDVEKDRNHPVKCMRPIASGAVSMQAAWAMAVVLTGLSTLFNVFCGNNWAAWLALVAYLALNILYSLGLKSFPIVDVAILSAGYLLRVLYGSALTGIEISKWLYLTVVSLAFYLGLGKRRNELSRQGDAASRAVLKHYSESFLDKNMYMCLALGIVFYSLWTVDTITIERTGSTALVWTVPLVILIFLKYSLNVEGPSDGDPVEVLLGDKLLLGLVAVLGIGVLGIVYL